MRGNPMYYLTWFLLIFALSDIAFTTVHKYFYGGRLEFLEPLGFLGTTFTVFTFELSTFVSLMTKRPIYKFAWRSLS